jgi:hypothetical protein
VRGGGEDREGKEREKDDVQCRDGSIWSVGTKLLVDKE